VRTGLVNVVRDTGGDRDATAEPENELIIALRSRNRRHRNNRQKSRKK
jgi:hypothetical protein